jgi:hypothetical protein
MVHKTLTLSAATALPIGDLAGLLNQAYADYYIRYT